MTNIRTVQVGDYNLVTNNLNEIVSWLQGCSNADKTTSIVTINPEIYLQSWQNQEHAEAINKADLIVPDGVGIVWAGEYFNNSKYNNRFVRFVCSLKRWLFNKPSAFIPQRITGVDLSLKLCQANFLPIKIFGSKNSSATLAKQNLLKLNPQLQIDFYDQVFLNDACELNQSEKTFLFSDNKCIILLALGAPKQEIVMAKIKPFLAPGSIVIGVGGTIDFIAGKVKRAPIFMQRLGLEWLFRLAVEPKRIKRIINAVIVFPLTFIKKY